MELNKRDRDFLLCFFFSFYSFICEAFHFFFFFLNNVAIEKNFAERQWTLRGVSPVARDRFYQISPRIVRTFSGHARKKKCSTENVHKASYTQISRTYTEASLLSAVRLHSISCLFFFFPDTRSRKSRFCVDVHAFSPFERYGLSLFFFFCFKILGIALRSFSTLINAREEIYVSLTSEYLHTRMETREKRGRNSNAIIFVSKWRDSLEDSRRYHGRFAKSYEKMTELNRVRIVFFTEYNNFVGFYDIVSSLRSICHFKDANSPFKSNDAGFSRLCIWLRSFIGEYVEFDKNA